MDDKAIEIMEQMYAEIKENQKFIKERLEAIEDSIARISSQMDKNSESLLKEISSIQDTLIETEYDR